MNAGEGPPVEQGDAGGSRRPDLRSVLKALGRTVVDVQRSSAEAGSKMADLSRDIDFEVEAEVEMDGETLALRADGPAGDFASQIDAPEASKRQPRSPDSHLPEGDNLAAPLTRPLKIKLRGSLALPGNGLPEETGL